MLVLTAVSALLVLAQPSVALWPQPTQITTGTTPLKLAPGFSIRLNGVRNAPRDLAEAASRTEKFLRDDKLALLVPDRGQSLKGPIKAAKALRSLTVTLSGGAAKSISEEAIAPLGTRSEGYTLTVPSDGSDAVLSANSTLGLFRGLTTFSQLWYDVDGQTFTNQAPVAITDAPAYVSFPSLTS
jgi:hexosaminidase